MAFPARYTPLALTGIATLASTTAAIALSPAWLPVALATGALTALARAT